MASPRPPLRRISTHAIHRARERYRMELTGRDLRAMSYYIEAAITAKATTKIREPISTYHGCETRMVFWNSAWVLLVWDPVGHIVVTFLPLGAEFTEDGVPMVHKWALPSRDKRIGTTPRQWRVLEREDIHGAREDTEEP